jgi:antitoxin component YwqK of YwqJK toxin-antitoxin module
MKKSSLSLLLLFTVSGLIHTACERLETRKEKYPSGKLKARYEVTVSKKGEFKNGVFEEFWENKKRKCIVNYLDDKPHGVYRSYYESGKMEAEIYFLEGMKNGEYKEWYENGKKKRFATYREGQLHSTIKTWDVDGKLSAKAKFHKGVCKSGDCGKIAPNESISL